jgi:hypothetical protein
MQWVVCIKRTDTGRLVLLSSDMSIAQVDPRYELDVHIVPCSQLDEGKLDFDFGVHEFTRECCCHPKTEPIAHGRTFIIHREAVN